MIGFAIGLLLWVLIFVIICKRTYDKAMSKFLERLTSHRFPNVCFDISRTLNNKK